MAIRVGRKQKSIGIGLLKTIPFIAAGILALILFYSQDNHMFDRERELIILIIFFFLSLTVFFAVSRQLPYSTRDVIDDLLVATLYQLGGEYRINIMKLVKVGFYEGYFKMVFAHGYRNPRRYRRKITMHIRGASSAYNDKDGNVFYLPYNRLDHDIDPEIKHLWSVAIKDRHTNSVAVLNIDNTIDHHLSQDIIQKNMGGIKDLAELIETYWEIDI